MKKKILVATLLLVMIMSLCMMVSCGDDKMEKATITSVWREDEFSAALPKVEFGKLFSITDFVNHDRILYVVEDVTEEDFAGFREDMVAFGYSEDKVESDEDSITTYYSREGWNVRLFYSANLTIKVFKK